jgi:ubiquinone/menaquinone biosynthesis C-methylase UbiE
MIIIARELTSKYRFYVATDKKLPFDYQVFDVVLSSLTLHH